jgi:hypothetical protein
MVSFEPACAFRLRLCPTIDASAVALQELCNLFVTHAPKRNRGLVCLQDPLIKTETVISLTPPYPDELIVTV